MGEPNQGGGGQGTMPPQQNQGGGANDGANAGGEVRETQPPTQPAGVATHAAKTRPNTITAEDFATMQGRYRNTVQDNERQGLLTVMLNKKFDLDAGMISDAIGLRKAWCEGCINAWNNGGLPLLQSYVGNNGLAFA